MSKVPSSVPWKPLGNTGVHYWLVQRMAKQTGVDVAQAQDDHCLSQEDWSDMVQTCRACEEAGACDSWLKRHDDDHDSEPPEYCLNAKILKTLGHEQSKAR